jgi:hypothetical protein
MEAIDRFLPNIHELQAEKGRPSTRDGSWVKVAESVGKGVTADQCLNRYGSYQVDLAGP